MSYHFRKCFRSKTKLSGSKTLVSFYCHNRRHTTVTHLNNFSDLFKIINDVKKSSNAFKQLQLYNQPSLSIEKIIYYNFDKLTSKNITKLFQNITKYNDDIKMGEIVANNKMKDTDIITFYYYYNFEYMQKDFIIGNIFNENVENFGYKLLS